MATPVEPLEREKRKRAGLRTSTTKLLTKIDRELQNEEVDNAVLDIVLVQLAEKEAALNKADIDVENLTVDLDALEVEISTREEYKEKIIDGKMRADRHLKGVGGGARLEPPRRSDSSSLSASTTVRLPRLNIQKFNGNSCDWQNFWAQYHSAIHENASLVSVDKFNYLKGFLEGTALAAISGLPLTADNYKKAVEILVKRFGQKDALISAHMNKLLSITPVKRSHDLSALRRLYDECEIQIRSLESLGMGSESYGSLLCPLLFKVIPDELTLEFNRRRNDQEDLKVAELLSFIRKEVESRERSNLMTKREEPVEHRSEGLGSGVKMKSNYFSQNDSQRKGPRQATAAALNTAVEEACLFCEKANHKTDDCTFLSIAEKKDLLRSRGRCYICFKKRHLSKNCRSNVVCQTCQKRHRKGICYQAYPEGQHKKDTIVASVVPNAKQGKHPMETVLLQTIRAVAEGPDTKSKIRILLDGGSQRTFIREDLSRNLKLAVVGEENLSLHTFGKDVPVTKKLRKVKVILRPEKAVDTFVEIEALEIPEICTALIEIPSVEIKEKVAELGIQLSDQPEGKDTNWRISVLIGSDFYWKIVTGEVKRLTNSLAVIESILGWSVQGVMMTSNLTLCNNMSVGIMNVVIHDIESDELLTSAQLKRFWELDSLGIVEDKGDVSITGEEALRLFNSTVSFDNDRYEVHLPWKNEMVGWPDNYEIAEKRLRVLINKFQRNPALYASYKEIIDNQIKTGVAEEIPVAVEASEENNAVFYLPHQAVIRPDKMTTKMRVVFDASSHKQNAPSLNDLLHPGPNLNPDLLNLLFKFRGNRVAFTADIEKAFLQIGLAKEDRDAVRFLWIDGLPDEHVKIKTLRMTRVLFGVTSSPFLLAAVLKHHVNKYEDQYPETCAKLSDSLYVDDWICGSESIDDAFRASSEARNIFKEGSFFLRKWKTNSEALLTQWKEAGFDTGSEVTIIGDQRLPNKVLGLIWDTQRDIFKFDVSSVLEYLATRKKTKRCVLQAAGRIFDPIGFLSPFTIRVKILFQELWERGLQWDEPLPDEICKEWDAWCHELATLHRVTVPRYCFVDGGQQSPKNVQLHCFVDASEKAYGTVVYIRYQTRNEERCYVSFITSKTRVAPLKKLSIPRLELLGALVGARLVSHLKKTFPPEVNVSYHFWTDSLISLCWIRNASSSWKPFVGNRVQEIQSLTEPVSWQHCPGTDNPADSLTRGKSIVELVDNRVWWEGPYWLQMSEEHWPRVATDEIIQLEQDSERRKLVSKCTVQVSLASERNVQKEPLLYLNRYSNLSKVVRVTAWICRFVHNVRKPEVMKKGPLEPEELHAAESWWIKEIQMTSFGKEVIALKSGKELEKTSRLLNLNPFLDENGLIRVGGRLQYANLTFEEKHPLLLPDKNQFSTLQIKDSHQKTAHGGLAETLTQLRGRLWILKARQLTKSAIHDCNLCKRHKAKPLTEEMAPLPEDRIRIAPPFEITGVDFAGPIYTKEGKGSAKSYIALFTCAVTRAIHLELVSDLTTERFLQAFKRFISRRGVCKIIYSDNAKTFKAAERSLKELWSRLKGDELKEFFGTQGITWRYIVERAAWWGGFWERMVRSVKTCLKKILGKASLTFEELTTTLVQVEAVLNSRPLTYTSCDINDPTPLTPAHFLIGKRLTTLPERMTSTTRVTSNRQDLTRRVVYQQTLMNSFWTQWKNQYLLELRSAHYRTPFQKTVEIKEGDVVLINEIRTPRLLWKMGRVKRTFRGRDEKIRSCSVRLPDGTVLKRPIQLLYPLEVTPSKDVDQTIAQLLKVDKQ